MLLYLFNIWYLHELEYYIWLGNRKILDSSLIKIRPEGPMVERISG